MIRSLARAQDGTLSSDLTEPQIQAVLADPEAILWLDILLTDENRDRIKSLLEDTFAFHPLAVDDALTESHVPRVDDWDSYLYIVLHAAGLEGKRRLETLELDLFLGARYLVTIHEAPVPSLDHLWDQCVHGAERRMAFGTDRLLYALADAVVADYMPVVEGLDEQLDAVEGEVFRRPRPQLIGTIFRIRRTLLALRRVLALSREVMNRLARDDYPMIDADDRLYFRDVYDHLVRLYDLVEGLRDVVGGALESYLGVTSNRLNEVMRTLTVVTVLFLPMNFLASFFGMNFFGEEFNVHNPYLSTGLLWICVALMLLTPLGMLAWMIHSGMLRPVDKPNHSFRR